ncbi:MAG: BlaI/MecI/CopY family transcriptional regulator [Bacteroidetes bacterium]|nr:MAG: BlaI/MecI/CopY family transcriptional regulator [Bacteroidota bacterium]
MKELTRAEEEIMQVLWELEKGFVRDVIERLPDPKPAYTTVSTIIRILEKKGFIGHKAFGKTHQYFPLVEKKTYTKQLFRGMLSNYFGNSVQQMVSFFSRDKDLSVSDLEAMKKILDDEIRKQEGG